MQSIYGHFLQYALLQGKKSDHMTLGLIKDTITAY